MKNALDSFFRGEHVSQSESASPLNSVFGLIVCVIVTVLFGLTMLYSTSGGFAGSVFFKKQLIWALLGSIASFAIIIVGYRRISEYSGILILASVTLLIIALFCPAVKGAHRWIKIPSIGNLQPSEFAKLVLIIFLAKYCSEKLRFLNTLAINRGLLPATAVCALVLGLIFLGKDWGTTFLLGAVVMLIFFAAGVRLRYLIPPLAISPLLFYYIKYFDKERWSRLTSFLDPEKCQQSDGYQVWHSILALGSGHWGGMGFTESRMKQKYLPEAHTDFILAIVGEELGFIFLCLVIIAYIVFCILAVKICVRAKNKHGVLLGYGLTMLITIQAIINIGVISGAFPTKGMPAPFISYGGSNLVMCLCAVGLLVSIGLESAEINPFSDALLKIPGFKTIHKKLIKGREFQG